MTKNNRIRLLRAALKEIQKGSDVMHYEKIATDPHLATDRFGILWAIAEKALFNDEMAAN